MPHPTTLIGRIYYAAICGIVVFLVVLGIGHFMNAPEGQNYGNEVKGLAAVLGVLYASYVFFTGKTIGPSI